MDIRPYTPQYFAACLAIFRSNLPDYFDAAEEEKFVQFLQREPETYFVLIDSGEVKACGGYYIGENDGRAGLSWGMVDRRFHRQGLGTQLLTFRLQKLQDDFPDAVVVLDTSQHTYQFFARFGFEVQRITPNGYGVGLDCYEMRLNASACQ